MTWLFLFPAGIFSVAYWPSLPGNAGFILLLGVGLLSCLLRYTRWLGWLLLGMVYGVFAGNRMVAEQLPDHWDKTDVIVQGQVIDLPHASETKTRFYFRADSFQTDTLLIQQKGPIDFFQQPRRLLLNWYTPPLDIKTDQKLTLKLRIRTPRGNVNPGGFDYQAWLLRQGVSATGYVREFITTNATPTKVASINGLRFRIREYIQAMVIPEQAKALLIALTVGDKQQFSKAAWENYARVGVVHLLVISGLHIGLAALAGYWIFGLVARLLGLFVPKVTARTGSLIAALVFSLVYGALAGWSIPAQRAAIMVAVVVISKLLCRNLSKSAVYGFALVFVTLCDPLAILDAGFWLSFTAVAMFFWSFSVYVFTPQPVPQIGQQGFIPEFKVARLWRFFIIQLSICVGLMALLIANNLPVSVIAPFANMLAIPWLSFLIVPFCLLGSALFLINVPIAEMLWRMAAWQMDWFSQWVAVLGTVNWLTVDVVLPRSYPVLGTLLFATMLLILPLGRLTKLPAMVLFIAITQTKPLEPALKVSVLDVGQGLAVVIQTPGHRLIYDTGPRFSGDLSAGETIVAPFLNQWGFKTADRLIISHTDSDHSGGAEGFLKEIQTSTVITDDKHLVSTLSGSGKGQPVFEPCANLTNWAWGEVKFTLINPAALHIKDTDEQKPFDSDNNLSCVLLVDYRGDKILLAGDIESPVEHLVIQSFPELTGLKLLVAPHHGSKTSSSREFVQQLAPQVVVFSAGFRHHFGHPDQGVVKRYQQVGAQTFNTASSGGLDFIWEGGVFNIRQQRIDNARYWFSKQ